jgi:hypothetical protein
MTGVRARNRDELKSAKRNKRIHLWFIASDGCERVCNSQNVSYYQLRKVKMSWAALFCNVTQCRVIILYWRFGTTYRSRLQGSRNPRRKLSSRAKKSKKKVSSWTSWPLKIGPIDCPETSVQNYHSTLRDIPKQRRSHRNRGGSLKSREEELTILY